MASNHVRLYVFVMLLPRLSHRQHSRKGIATLQLNSRCMNTHLPTSERLAPPYNILTTDTSADTFNNNKTIPLGISSLPFAAAPRRAIATPRHAFSVALCSHNATTTTYHTTSTHMADATAINCTHLSLDTTTGIPSPPTTTISTTTGFIRPYCHRTDLRHTIHLDFCPPMSRATATHTSSSSFSDSSTSPVLPAAITSSRTTS